VVNSPLRLRLPKPGGSVADVALSAASPIPATHPRPRSREVYAAAHVVADPLADNAPGAPSTLDWDATLAYRHHLWRHGFHVAEAMDTAQRGMGLDWSTIQELIRRSAAEARSVDAVLACGAGTDQLRDGPVGLEDVRAAYEEQVQLVESAGARVILMASRHLARAARGADDYAAVYGSILRQVRAPVILHWLGTAFDPALSGYWGSSDLDVAADVVLDLIKQHQDQVDGIKISLLDKDREIEFRRRLPTGVRLYTGDDFSFPELIRGDAERHSDALLGIFDAIAPVAAAALQALDRDDTERYESLLAPTVPLARHIFAAPTYYYKTGLTFLAWLNGHQRHFRMVAGLEAGRSVVHLAEVLVLADRAGLLSDPELAARRMRSLLEVCGVPQ
jgi:Protein of unknown function (DUF993)